MKRIFYLVLLVTITCLSTTSCSKEQINGPASVGNNTNSQSSPQILYLTVNSWQQDQPGLYSHTFYNIMSTANGHQVSVYLLNGGQEIPINQFIPFMGGQLWATYSTTDVRIFFRNNTASPSFLNIKVVTE
jgi:hypothetical protein